MHAKVWWQSKTFWFNVLFLVITAAVPVLNHLGWSEFEPSPEFVTIGGILVTVVNLVLRLVFTRDAVTFKRR